MRTCTTVLSLDPTLASDVFVLRAGISIYTLAGVARKELAVDEK